MTDERDPKVSTAYRELGTPEPPRALDEAILARARHMTQTWMRRWAVPLSIAAVVVLSVTVTLRIQHEQTGVESPATAHLEIAAAAPAPEKLQLKAEDRLKAAAAAPARERRAKPASQAEPKPFAPPVQEQAAAPAPAPAAVLSSRADAARGAESSVTGSLARQAEERTARDAAAAARAPQIGPVQALAKRAELAAAAKSKVESPDRELERIAQLRREGRHEEADKALAEFRRLHPDFKIPEAMLERLERR